MLKTKMATAEQFYELLKKTVSKTRLDNVCSSDQQGLFWDETVLTSEELMLQGVAKNMDLVVALIDGKLARDIPRTSISEGIRMLDKDVHMKLFCVKCGSHEEWLRAEGNTLKKLLGLIRLTEYRSIDFSRQSGTMKLLCEKWRAMTDALGGRRKSKEGLRSTGSALVRKEGGKKAIWDMSVDDVAKLIAGKEVVPVLGSLVQDVFSDTDSLDADVVDLIEPRNVESKNVEPQALENQEVEDTQADPSEEPQPPGIGASRYYMDYGNRKIMRCWANGRIEPGIEIEDDEPFIWFRWADGIEKESEFPREIQVVRRRPAANIPNESRKKARLEEEEQGKTREKDEEETEEEEGEEEKFEEEEEEEEELEEDIIETGDETILQTGDEALKKLAIQPNSWMPGAAIIRNFADDVVAFNWSNGFGQGVFRVTYAKDQTYVQCHLPDKTKIFFLGITVKYKYHKEIVQSVCSDLLALGEEHYEDLSELKKMAVKLRDEKLSEYK